MDINIKIQSETLLIVDAIGTEYIFQITDGKRIWKNKFAWHPKLDKKYVKEQKLMTARSVFEKFYQSKEKNKNPLSEI